MSPSAQVAVTVPVALDEVMDSTAPPHVRRNWIMIVFVAMLHARAGLAGEVVLPSTPNVTRNGGTIVTPEAVMRVA
jgi:hypothetical protein